MNYMLGFLVACIALGLWGPKRVRSLPWLIPVAAVLLVAFFLVTSLHRV
jgi:quinol-cytochrome oxidoreductase complex cytochrome b subunit